MRNLTNKMMMTAAALILSGCGGAGSSSSSDALANLKVRSASIAASDKGMLLTKSSGVSAASTNSASGILSDNLMRVVVDGSMQSVEFTVENPYGEMTTQTVAIRSTKPLDENYVALDIANGRVGIMNVSNGDVYDISGVDFDTIQIWGNDVYSLNVETGLLFRVDLSDPELTVHPLNDLLSLSNTGYPTSIYSTLHSEANTAFRFTSSFNPSSTTPFVGVDFVVTDAGVYGLSGPSGGRRIMRFREGQQSFDCASGTVGIGTLFGGGGGGTVGGHIQTANKDIYRVQMIANGDPSYTGDRLVKLPISNSPSTCVDLIEPVIVNLGATSNFFEYFRSSQGGTKGVNDLFLTEVNVSLSTTKRYIANPEGFLKTDDDGSGGLTLTWTALDLSDIPTLDDTKVSCQGCVMSAIDGDSIYYRKNNSFYSRELASGSQLNLFHTSVDDIKAFKVLAGALYYTTTRGDSYVVREANGTREKFSNGAIAGMIVF